MWNIALITAVVCLFLVTGASFLGQYGPWLDVWSAGRLAYSFAGVLLACIFAYRRTWLLAALASLVVLLNASQFALFFKSESSERSGASGIRLKVLGVNVFGPCNTKYQAVIDYINCVDADIVGLSENNQAWTEKLIAALPQYAYRSIEVQGGGIGLLSKYPLESTQIRYFDWRRRPRIETIANVNGTKVSLILAHPVVPLAYDNMGGRELLQIADEIPSKPKPLILFGDLNTTPWSYYFQNIKNRGLIDSEAGFGFQPSFPCSIPITFLPIDHCLVSDQVTVARRELGPNVGSDHLPVFLELSLLQKKPASIE